MYLHIVFRLLRTSPRAQSSVYERELWFRSAILATIDGNIGPQPNMNARFRSQILGIPGYLQRMHHSRPVLSATVQESQSSGDGVARQWWGKK